jgi:ribulose kinase
LCFPDEKLNPNCRFILWMDVALIIGSFHLLLGLTKNDVHSPSISGSFPDAVIPGLRIMEGSQISTMSVLKWFSTIGRGTATPIRIFFLGESSGDCP